MKIRLLKSSCLEQLRQDIKQNLDKYRSGDFEELKADKTNWFEIDAEYEPGNFGCLLPRKGNALFEHENCDLFYQNFGSITANEARDERLWTYLSHTDLLDFTRERWTIPEDDTHAIKFIQSHFFASSMRALERDNAVSRLWWMAHLCSKVDGVERQEALKVLLHRADVRANIVERPTISQSTILFSILIKKLKNSLEGDAGLFKRTPFRMLMGELNSIGGHRLLDCLSEQELDTIIDGISSNEGN